MRDLVILVAFVLLALLAVKLIQEVSEPTPAPVPTFDYLEYLEEQRLDELERRVGHQENCAFRERHGLPAPFC